MRHHINVRESGNEFVLHNHEAICGPRLYHGEDIKDPAQKWPFKGEFVRHKNRASAEDAARKLQSYLEARDSRKARK